MKHKTVLLMVITLIVSLACQFFGQTPSGESEVPTQLSQETIAQPTVTVNPLPGLVYGVYDEEKNEQTIWQIDDDGKTHMLLPNHTYGMLSPDGKQFVYYDKFYGNTVPCAWLIDFGTNETLSLDCSTGGDSLPAYILGWIPSQPDTLLAILERSGGGMGGATGFLGTISIKTGDKEILDSDHYIQSAQISPNGDMVAYGADEFPLSGWLYSWDSGVSAFNPQDYGIDYSQIGSPVWSPDGTKMAWGLMDNEFNSVIGVFDLDKKTAKVLHPFKQEIMPDLRPSPTSSVWSPNGQLLAIETFENNLREWWIISADGQTEYKIDGEFKSWSPDGQWLLYTTDLELYIAHLDGSEEKKLGEMADYDSSTLWSKDGRYFAFVDNDEKIRYTEVGVWEVDEATGVDTVSNLIDWVVPMPALFESVEILPATTVQPTETQEQPNLSTSEVVDDYGVSMVLVPEGEFTMGNDADIVLEECKKLNRICELEDVTNQEPAHQAYLDAFYIDKYEVTNALYKTCVDIGICKSPVMIRSWSRDWYYGNPEFDNYPVVYVDWNMAMTYCEWRGAKLPTEAQWEKAARGIDGRVYPWGKDFDEKLIDFDPNKGPTKPVGSYEDGKSPYGLYEMVGNVTEWVNDRYSDTYYQSSPLSNPIGPSAGQERVIRGEPYGGVTYRYHWDSTLADFWLGFRCAKNTTP